MLTNMTKKQLQKALGHDIKVTVLKNGMCEVDTSNVKNKK